MCDDVEFLLERLSNQANTNECVVSYNEKCCKIDKSTDYFPDDNGIVVFKKQVYWSDIGMTVGRMIEFLKRYGDMIKDIKFEGSDGEVHDLVNIYETNVISSNYEYNCMLVVGRAGDVMQIHPAVEKPLRRTVFY